MSSSNEPAHAAAGSPRIAVLIAAKDAAATIERAVASALQQPETAEVVVIDDGSGDDTAERARRCDEEGGRVTVVRQANRGPAAARNRAIESSSAPLICVLDADDFMLPGRLGRLIARGGEDWDFLADDLLVRDGSIDRPAFAARTSGTLSFAEFVLGNISRPGRPRAELGFLKPVIRRSFLQDHRLAYDESLRLGEDYALYADALARGARFRMVETCGYVSVVRAGSLSDCHRPEDLYAMYQADLRLAKAQGLGWPELKALRRHAEMMRLKWNHRRVLQAKREGRLAQALAIAFGDPATTAFVAAETVRARRKAARARVRAREVAPPPPTEPAALAAAPEADAL